MFCTFITSCVFNRDTFGVHFKFGGRGQTLSRRTNSVKSGFPKKLLCPMLHLSEKLLSLLLCQLLSNGTVMVAFVACVMLSVNAVGCEAAFWS